DIFVDSSLEIPDSYFLIIAECQSVLGACLQPLLLHEQILGVLVHDAAKARIHALRFGERLLPGQMFGLGRLRAPSISGHRAQEEYLELRLAVADRAKPVSHRQ